MKKLRKNKITIILGLVATLGFSNLSLASDDFQYDKESEMSVINKNHFITEIDFLFEKDNTGVIELGINKSFNNKIDIKEREKYIQVKLKDVFLPKHLSRKIVVDQFDTNVDYIDSYYEENSTVLKIFLKDKSKITVEKYSDKIHFAIVPIDDKNVNEKVYKGQPINIEFQDISVREALRVLATYTDFNLVTTDSVQGNITISLKDVPFEHALDVILQSKGLGQKITQNIIYIAPSEELLKLEEDKLTAKNKINNLAELESKFFQIKYAKADDVLLVAETLISDRGRLIVDSRTNTLIVKDIEDVIKEIEGTIEKLDVPIKQVLIEARIVIARKSKSEEFGVRWGGVFFDGQTYAGDSYNTVIDHFTSEEFINDGTTLLSNQPAVDLGVTNPAGSFALGLSSSTGLLDLELSALEENGDGEVIARPKLITADKKTAIIQSGVQIPYQQAAGGAGGATTIAFKDAVMLLEATPQITPDDRIILDLKINQDSIGQNTEGGPSIDTTQIETQVLVNNGETIVLGGIFQSEIIADETKVPLLGDIPAVGKLFRNTAESERKTELLFFITPKLIENDIIKY